MKKAVESVWNLVNTECEGENGNRIAERGLEGTGS